MQASCLTLSDEFSLLVLPFLGVPLREMSRHHKQLQDFEEGLDPQYPEHSKIKATVKGYGEISSIFSVAGIPGWIFKRLPLFADMEAASQYVEHYKHYTASLKRAGLQLPKDSTDIIKGENIVLYIGQEELSKESFCHNLLHSSKQKDALDMIQKILLEIAKVFAFNEKHKPAIELSLDGQVSNWAQSKGKIMYIDTSTPLSKLNGKEQLDPELLLNSTPKALKWVIRQFFLQDVMDRYYDMRRVYIDLIANLYKEKSASLIPNVIHQANQLLPKTQKPITEKEIASYYKEDKFIWQLFLALRKIDRWLTNKIFRKRYQFILPGEIIR